MNSIWNTHLVAMTTATIVSIFGISIGVAHANDSPPIQLLGMKGTCNKLVVGPSNYTAKCQGQVLNSAYQNGRVGFWFLLQDGSVFTFSGMDGENPTDDSDVIVLDKMIVNLGGGMDHSKVVSVSGKCIYTNPYLGQPANVSCSGAFTKGQRFSAIFVSDGNPPN